MNLVSRLEPITECTGLNRWRGALQNQSTFLAHVGGRVEKLVMVKQKNKVHVLPKFVNFMQRKKR